MGIASSPELFTDKHDVSQFDSGNATLNEWLVKNALKNQSSGASRTFVICEQKRVIGYYTLASGSVERVASPGSIGRNMPNPIPVVVLGRLAIDINYQGKRLGIALLKNAMIRTLMIAQNVDVRAILVHAISDEAKAFYLRYGFQISRTDPMTLFLSIKVLKNALGE